MNKILLGYSILSAVKRTVFQAPDLASGAGRARRSGSRARWARLSNFAGGALVVRARLGPVVVAVRSGRAARARVCRGRHEQRAVVLGSRLTHLAAREAFGVSKGTGRTGLALRAVVAVRYRCGGKHMVKVCMYECVLWIR